MLLNEKEARAITEKLLSYVKADDAQVAAGSEKKRPSALCPQHILTSGNTVERNASITVWRQRSARLSIHKRFRLTRASKRWYEQAEQVAAISPLTGEYLPTLPTQTITVNALSKQANISLANRARDIGEILLGSKRAGVIGAGFTKRGHRNKPLRQKTKTSVCAANIAVFR